MKGRGGSGVVAASSFSNRRGPVHRHGERLFAGPYLRHDYEESLAVDGKASSSIHPRPAMVNIGCRHSEVQRCDASHRDNEQFAVRQVVQLTSVTAPSRQRRSSRRDPDLRRRRLRRGNVEPLAPSIRSTRTTSRARGAENRSPTSLKREASSGVAVAPADSGMVNKYVVATRLAFRKHQGGSIGSDIRRLLKSSLGTQLRFDAGRERLEKKLGRSTASGHRGLNSLPMGASRATPARLDGYRCESCFNAAGEIRAAREIVAPAWGLMEVEDHAPSVRRDSNSPR